MTELSDWSIESTLDEFISLTQLRARAVVVLSEELGGWVSSSSSGGGGSAVTAGW